MRLRRNLFKLAVPMMIGYFLHPQSGSQRRQRLARKMQRMMGKTSDADSLDYTPGSSGPTVISEIVTERIVLADGNGRVVGEATVEAGGSPN